MLPHAKPPVLEMICAESVNIKVERHYSHVKVVCSKLEVMKRDGKLLTIAVAWGIIVRDI